MYNVPDYIFLFFSFLKVTDLFYLPVGGLGGLSHKLHHGTNCHCLLFTD